VEGKISINKNCSNLVVL